MVEEGMGYAIGLDRKDKLLQMADANGEPAQPLKHLI